MNQLYNNEQLDLIPSHEKFSAPLKECFAALMEVDINDYVVEYYEDHKEEIIPCLGVSFRQWQIDFSEKFMKPLYGNDIFGRLMKHRIHQSIDQADTDAEEWIYVISDCGFQIEVDHILKSIEPKNILLIRLHRKDCDFSGDSRGYVEAPGCAEMDIQNHGTEAALEAMLKSTVEEWLATT